MNCRQPSKRVFIVINIIIVVFSMVMGFVMAVSAQSPSFSESNKTFASFEAENPILRRENAQNQFGVNALIDQFIYGISNILSSSQNQIHHIFLPVVLDTNKPINPELPGLDFSLPDNWSPIIGMSSPPTNTNTLVDNVSAHFRSSDDKYVINILVDWHLTAPEAIYGSFGLNALDGYIQSITTLDSGESVQVSIAEENATEGNFLVAHAAFRSDDVSYAIQLYGYSINEQAITDFDLLINSLEPLPVGLSSTYSLKNQIAVHLSSPSAFNPTVAYDRMAARQYAIDWGVVYLLDNVDDCYLWQGSGLTCTYHTGDIGVDGAHFMNLALRAGGLNVPPLWAYEAIRSRELRAWLLANGGIEISDPNSLEPGDMIFFGTSGTACQWGWGGVVIGVDSQGPLINLHSRVSNGITTNWPSARYTQIGSNACGTTNQYSFVHIDDVQSQPGPLVSQSLSLSPSAPAAGEDVQATFQVCNYGGNIFDTDSLFVSVDAPGIDFPSVDPPQLAPGDPGGCYDYTESVAAFPSSGIYQIRAGYLDSNGNFQTLDTIAGVINEQSVVVLSDMDIQIEGEIAVNPQTVAQGETAVVNFTARNVSSNSLADRFRIRVYDENDNLVMEFPETGTITFDPGETYTYDENLTFDVPGIYWVQAEHDFNSGDWRPVHGNSRTLVRVTYPIPEPPKLAKGMPDFIALDGEPVNTGSGNFVHQHTDTMIPMPGMPFNLTRYYNHIDADEVSGDFGPGWTWTLGQKISWRDDKSAVMTYPDGREVYLFGEWDADDPFNMAGEYVGQFAETNTILRLDDGTAVYTDTNHIRYEFDEDGLLASVWDGNENGFEILRDGNGRIDEIQHSGGTVYAFAYIGDTISSITLPNGSAIEYTYTNGDLTEVTKPAGESINYTYDNQHRMITIQDGLDQTILVNEYDVENRIASQVNTSGITSTFEYPSDEITVFIDEGGYPVTYTYDSEMRVISMEDARGAVTGYEYDEDFNRVKEIDPMGGVWQWGYDEHGRIVSTTNPLGATRFYTYSVAGDLVAEQNPLGQVQTYAYDDNHNLIKVTDAEDAEIIREYTTEGLLYRVTDPTGATVTYAYNEFGLPEVITDELGSTITMAYDAMGNRTHYTDAEGRTTISAFDEAGRTISTISPLGNVLDFTYDNNGNLKSETDGDGHTRFYVYDEQDRLTERTDYRGNVWLFEYDELDQRTLEGNPLGGTVIYTYDAVGNILTRENERGGVWLYEYDLNGNEIVVIDPLGNITYKTYDAANQLVAVDYPCDACAGGRAVKTIVYDLAGNEIEYTDGRGFTTTYDYDGVGRLITETNPLSETVSYVYNGRSDLIEIIDATGNSTYRQYNPASWLITETNRLGYETVWTYDRVGNVLAVENGRSFTTQYEYDAADRVIQKTDALGGITQYEYDFRGNVLTMTDALSRTTTYLHDPDNNLLSITNPRGFTTNYEYDALSREIARHDAITGTFTTEYDPMGAVLTETNEAGYIDSYSYDMLGQRLTHTDSNGYITQYEYDSQGNLVLTIDPLNGEMHRVYDANNNMVSVTNALGYTTQYEYDSLNRQVTVIDALDGISSREYDELGNLSAETDANGHTITYQYDAEGRRTSETDALTHITTYEYDANDNLVRLVDRNGHETVSEYDPLDRPVVITNSLSYTSTVTYDVVGNRIAERNNRGFITEYEYDANDNLIRRIDALDGQTVFVYDALDRNTQVIDANMHTVTTTFDAVGNTIAVTLHEGQTTKYLYDGEYNQIAFINAKGYTTTYTYDGLNRLILETDPLNHPTYTGYDAISQVITETDALNNSNYYAYDPLGRLITVTDALSYATIYGYDPVGNLLVETNANGNSTTYEYDPLNRLITETNPMLDQWVYTYDPEGNLIEQVDANGQTILYAFDAEDQMVAIEYEDDTPDVTMAYDPNGNMVAMVDGIGTTTFTYDPLDRLVSEVDGHGRSTHYSYDFVSNRIGVTYPSGNNTSYAYNGNNWLIATTDPMSGTTAYHYDPDGLPTFTQFPNGTWTDRVYDKADRLVQQYNGTIYQFDLITSYDYTLDAVGNRTQVIEQYVQGQIRTNIKTYTYNVRYELLESVEQYEGPPVYTVTASYTYDPAGNRLTMTDNRDDGQGPQPEPETISYSYDAANHMLSAGETAYNYDNNGNRIRKFTLATPTPQSRLETYEYDAENRLVYYERARLQNGQIEQRVYNTFDGLGRRMEKGLRDGNGQIKWTHYVLDGLSYDQLEEYPLTGQPIVIELYRGLGNELVSMDEIQGSGQGSQYWFAADGLGSVAATSKQNGQSTHEFFYDPYGQLIDENGHWEDSSSWADPHNHYLLTGKEWDEKSRLYYFGARFYDAEAGVWLTQDPYRGNINSPMTRHQTLYVRNNPINRIDPLGFFEWTTGRVQWGDTWESIAVQWGTSVDELQRLNSWINTPKVGDYLQLPDCRSAQCQMRLGINDVRVNGMSGTACGQRIVQEQRAYQAWLAEQRRLAILRQQQEEQARKQAEANQEWQRELVKKGILPEGCGTTQNCEIPTGCGSNMSCPPPSITNTSSQVPLPCTSYLFCKPNYLNQPNGLFLDSMSLVVDSSITAYWNYYPYMSANQVTVVRTIPNLLVYTRTKPGVNQTASDGLATVTSITGSYIPLKSPPVKSWATPLTLAGVAYDGYSQYNEDKDRNDLDTAQKAGRVSLSVSASSGIAATAITAGTYGAAACTTFAPVVGTVACGAVGFIAGGATAFVGQYVWDKNKDKVFEFFGFD